METTDLDTNRDPSPWIPMTNPGDIAVINKMGEETGELIGIKCRCLIQGIDGAHPETGKLNKIALEDEIADVMAGCQMVIERFGLDLKHIVTRRDKKLHFIQKWIDKLDKQLLDNALAIHKGCGLAILARARAFLDERRV